MALIGNRSVLHKSPSRFLSGTIASGDRNAFSKYGMMMNRYQSLSKKSSLPQGALPPVSWVMPRMAGGLASHYEAEGLSIVTGHGAEGINIAATAAGSSYAEAIGQLIASAIGTAAGSSTAIATIQAALNASGTAAGSSTASAFIRAIANAIGLASGGSSASLIPYATGKLVGSTAVISELTPAAIATAVWADASGEAVLKLLGANVSRSGDIITIYEDDGITPWRQYDLANGGRVRQ